MLADTNWKSQMLADTTINGI